MYILSNQNLKNSEVLTLCSCLSSPTDRALGYHFPTSSPVGDADDLAVLVELLYKPIK